MLYMKLVVKQILVSFYASLFAHSVYVVKIHFVTSHKTAYPICFNRDLNGSNYRKNTSIQLQNKNSSCINIKVFSYSVVSHNAANASHLSYPGRIVVCDAHLGFISLYVFIY